MDYFPLHILLPHSYPHRSITFLFQELLLLPVSDRNWCCRWSWSGRRDRARSACPPGSARSGGALSGISWAPPAALCPPRWRSDTRTARRCHPWSALPEYSIRRQRCRSRGRWGPQAGARPSRPKPLHGSAPSQAGFRQDGWQLPVFRGRQGRIAGSGCRNRPAQAGATTWPCCRNEDRCRSRRQDVLECAARSWPFRFGEADTGAQHSGCQYDRRAINADTRLVFWSL